MIINRIYENQTLLSLQLVSFLVGLRTYQHPCISFDSSLVIYINSTNIPPIMIINRIYQNQNRLSLQLVSFLVGLRTYQHPCTTAFDCNVKKKHNMSHGTNTITIIKTKQWEKGCNEVWTGFRWFCARSRGCLLRTRQQTSCFLKDTTRGPPDITLRRHCHDLRKLASWCGPQQCSSTSGGPDEDRNPTISSSNRKC